MFLYVCVCVNNKLLKSAEIVILKFLLFLELLRGHLFGIIPNNLMFAKKNISK